MSNTETDTALVVRYCGGDHAAFAELYQRHRHGLFGYALSLCADEAEAADATQEIWLRAIEDARRLRSVHNVRAYLFAGLRNAVIDRFRRAQRERKALAQGKPATMLVKPRDTMTSAEEADRLDQALRRLPEEQREVVLLKIYGELTFAEIAEVLGENPRTVESRHRLALEKLREWLTP
ncbi:MAG: sigma-70 family RNA polymerase sigma factor [Planctomycetes bacterium]|nr:sigma-70 family RNA polymerase sigma factor [Planctomycetota bacterium]MCW8136061.1 sigma-70 family RNA polymerase sigma factor [Planctomycetota bacterium]